MLTLVATAAIRNLVLIAGIGSAAYLLRLRNIHTRTALWRCTLAACCAMPALLLWHPLPAPAPFVGPAAAIARAAAAAPAITLAIQSAPETTPATLHLGDLAAAIYIAITALLLARLAFGVLRGWFWLRAARPADGDFATAPHVRISAKFTVPVTFGGTILLPAEATAWPEAKRRAVLRHEQAHVAHHDFAVLLASALHRAIFWFNPAAWWLHNELCNLAEARSDAAALAEAPDRFDYAELLLGIAAQSRAVPAGVPMARPATINRRMSEILRRKPKEAPMTTLKYLLAAACVAAPAMLAAISVIPRAAADSTLTVGAATLDSYAGTYKLGPASIMTIAHQGTGLTAQLTGQPAFPVFAESATRFAYKVVKAEITFTTAPDGSVTGLVLHQNGADIEAPRITAAEAAADMTALQNRVARNQPQPGSDAALHKTIAAQIAGTPDYDDMTPQLAAAVRRQMPAIAPSLAQLGALQDIKFQGVTPKGWDLYDVRFANGDTQWRIALNASGKISGLLFQAMP